MKTGSLKNNNQQKSWVIIKIIQDYLCPLAIIDFTLQVIFQLPNIHFNDENVILMFDWFGLRKVWSIPSNAFFSTFF
jgi:hypothetical protein